MTLTPAYGRDYKSKKDLLADFDANKDFIVQDFMSPWYNKPINKEQLLMIGGGTVNIRYAKLARVAVVEVKK